MTEEQRLYQFFDAHGLTYERFSHPPVYTCKESKLYLPNLFGAHTKNLFLCDSKGLDPILVALPAHAKLDIRTLAQALERKRLQFSSPERLKKYLHVAPGSVTLLATLNDCDHNVTVVIDSEIWAQPTILCHPLVNTATVSLSRETLTHFFQLTGHTPHFMDVPRTLEV